jgi:hypothetical protein
VDVFKVLTTFKFDIGSAILNSEKLQNATDKLSQSAANALASYKALGIGIAGSFGLGVGSLAGTIYQAVTAAEKFNEVQDAMANIIGQNQDRFTTDIKSFNTRLSISAQLMQDLAKAAEEFALPQMEMLQQSKLMLPVLLNYGVQGKQFQNVIDISRGLLKSAPILGLDAGDVQGQLLRALQGGASISDPLFRALASETKAFQKFKGKDVTRMFNVLPIVERVELLRQGLLQFGSDSEFLARQVKTLRFQSQQLKNTLFGLNGIMMKMGGIIRETLINAFMYVNKTLETHGRTLVDIAVQFSGKALTNPRDFLIDLLSLSKIGETLKFAGTVAQIITFLEILQYIPKVGNFVRPAMKAITTYLLGFLNISVLLNRVVKAFKFIVPALKFVFTRLLPIVSVFVVLFQMLQKARAIGKVRDLEALPEALAKLATAAQNILFALQPLVAPLKAVWNFLTNTLAWVFEFSMYATGLAYILNGLAQGFMVLGKGIIIMEAGLRGFFTMLIGFIDQLFKFVTFQGGFSFQKFIDDYQAGIDDVFRENREYLFGSLQDLSKAPIAQMTTNIGEVNINQNFKEAQDPDRIAFTVQQALVKIAQNPTQAVNRAYPIGLAP